MDKRARAGYAPSWTTEGTSGETTVTEAEWLSCTDPQLMLEFLQGKASDRKLRLFACVSVRRIWGLLEDVRSRKAVEVAESFANGEVDRKELAAACAAADRAHFEAPRRANFRALDAAPHTAEAELSCSAADAAASAAEAIQVAAGGDEKAKVEECQQQARFLRCIFGNPFLPITITPAVLAWHDSTVVRLAQAAYDERHLPAGTLDNSLLAVLADALEEAGCTSEEILGHLRGPGPHVRGCWAVDLCLGKS